MNGLSHRAHPVDIRHRHFLEHDSRHFINGWFVVVGFPLRKKSYCPLFTIFHNIFDYCLELF